MLPCDVKKKSQQQDLMLFFSRSLQMIPFFLSNHEKRHEIHRCFEKFLTPMFIQERGSHFKPRSKFETFRASAFEKVWAFRGGFSIGVAIFCVKNTNPINQVVKLQLFFSFLRPLVGEMIRFDERMFQRGWFNQQLSQGFAWNLNVMT